MICPPKADDPNDSIKLRQASISGLGEQHNINLNGDGLIIQVGLLYPGHNERGILILGQRRV